MKRFFLNATIAAVALGLGSTACTTHSGNMDSSKSELSPLNPSAAITWPSWTSIGAMATASGQSATTLKVAYDATYLYVLVQGSGMGPNYDFFLNTDGNAATGYQDSVWSASGAEYLVENGTLYKSTGSGWSWSTVSGGVTATVSTTQIQLAITRASLGTLAGTITVGFRDVDASWSQRSILPIGAFGTWPLGGSTPPPSGTSMRIMVPAYFYPTDGTHWSRVVTQSAKMPGKIWMIANPNSGPGSAKDSAYTTGITNMKNAGGYVLGYVATGYGSRSATLVQNDVNAWYTWYPNIDGIFFDEQANTSGNESKYQGYYNYVKAKKSSALVIGNPGTSTIESYLYYNNRRVTDVICIYESDSGFSSWAPPSWCSKYGKENFYVLNIGCSSSSWQSYTDRAASKNVGWIYSTDRTLASNPWGGLSSYFETQCNYVTSKY